MVTGSRTSVTSPSTSFHKGSRARRTSVIRRRLLVWWASGGKRAFPWRHSRDPYAYYLAEMLLQRTRAENVAPVYRELFARAPTVAALAGLPLRSLRALIRPLGLPARADLISKAARSIVADFGSRVPLDPQELISLPGVGPYTARAVPVFAVGARYALLDWTTARVIGRLFGLPARKRPNADSHLRALARQLLGRADPRKLNWALIDLAATLCGVRPQCSECPLHSHCEVGRRGLTRRLR